MDVSFGCTSCGKCCQNLRVPLTLADASAWLARGHRVELLMDALLESADATPDAEAYMRYRHERAFPARSGAVPLHVTVTVAAQFEGNCPNLTANLRCAIYGERPLACRIYPAEFNPFVPFDRARKGCPPEAWTPDHPLLLRDGVPAAPALQQDIAAIRAQVIADVPMKAALCGLLGIHAAALANEGLLVFHPPLEGLRAALAVVQSGAASTAPVDWTLVTNRRSTAAALAASQAAAALARSDATGAVRYLAFLPDEP
jgi:Fe-S-cluster containining protein